MKPHKHAEFIKAWADGAEIEFRSPHTNEKWVVHKNPLWLFDHEYRIKPETKPDVVYYGVFGQTGGFSIDGCFTKVRNNVDQIKLTFDGETGKFKSAEVL